MKVFVTHNREGGIRSLVVQAPDAEGELEVLAGADRFVTEVEMEITADPRDEQALAEQLQRIAEGYRVEMVPPSQRGRLVKIIGGPGKP
jgi:hypothetical protein